METNLNKLVAMVFGYVLVVIGIVGFFVHPLLIFGLNPLHDVIHLATGALLLAGAYMDGGRNARTYNMVLGVVYVLVAILGFATPALMDGLIASGQDTIMYADAVLHALVGIVLLGVALAMKGGSPSGAGAMR